MQKIALIAHYTFAECGVCGRWHVWALHACMCARGRGNALHEHVFRSCGCHRAAAGLESSSQDCTVAISSVAERGIGSRGLSLAMGPSHCDYWL
jgi:hypothetical protein